MSLWHHFLMVVEWNFVASASQRLSSAKNDSTNDRSGSPRRHDGSMATCDRLLLWLLNATIIHNHVSFQWIETFTTTHFIILSIGAQNTSTKYKKEPHREMVAKWWWQLMICDLLFTATIIQPSWFNHVSFQWIEIFTITHFLMYHLAPNIAPQNDQSRRAAPWRWWLCFNRHRQPSSFTATTSLFNWWKHKPSLFPNFFSPKMLHRCHIRCRKYYSVPGWRLKRSNRSTTVHFRKTEQVSSWIHHVHDETSLFGANDDGCLDGMRSSLWSSKYGIM